ncbi:PCYCGC motif-containing (lipo)protein [Halalkalibacter nanhaiisediminis]|uniref:Uncharacterized protein with PCYCGC motif n=1 Tax=Halalkalibacter nanhaiisediminis TaxID=688079 RepID=A0A562QHL1_9BACI|nr:PCYCGC motif-containing (lipo)protein [Halalkalibacter nanhaiisediminis]TWI56221.1 uncharacterized protein with PCYCGC motif [Halalkalibacter nanhaiisediminis]
MKKLGILIMSVMLIAVGCQSGPEEESTTSEHTEHVNSLEDVHELTASIETLPSFLSNHPDTIADIYARVPHYQDVIEHMPCYCGCGETAGHRSSYDCFINIHNDDGSLVWDDHGAKCPVCLEIAYYSMELHDRGASLEEIREFVDDRYQEGFAEPTNTPMPSDV